jgi:hypothetical protein
MSAAPNLADPEVEPTDEELAGLTHRAFAHVRAERAAALDRLREEIAAERVRVLARLPSIVGPSRSST